METQEILQGIHDWTNGKIVYDISVAHPDGQGNPTPYADLTAALGAGGSNIPESLRKGGMSVKFIQGTAQSSDNKYVQARCMADSFTTDTTQWQVVDNVPVKDSKNLIESGAVEPAFSKITALHYLSSTSGSDDAIYDENYYITPYIPVSYDSSVATNNKWEWYVSEKKNAAYLLIYNAQKEVIGTAVANKNVGESRTGYFADGAAYIRASFKTNQIGYLSWVGSGGVIWDNRTFDISKYPHFFKEQEKTNHQIAIELSKGLQKVAQTLTASEKAQVFSNLGIVLDNTPTKDSNNFVKSGGVYDKTIGMFLDVIYDNAIVTNNNYNPKYKDGYYITPYIPISIDTSLENNKLVWHTSEVDSTVLAIFYDSSKSVIATITANAETKNSYRKETSLAYIRLSFKLNSVGYAEWNGNTIWDNRTFNPNWYSVQLKSIIKSVEDIANIALEGASFMGHAATSTNPPVFNHKAFYFATNGTFTNFKDANDNAIVVNIGEVAFLENIPIAGAYTVWNKIIIVNTLQEVTNSSNPVSGAAVIQALNSLGNDGYKFFGVVQPNSTPTQKEYNKQFYLAATAGTYTNFNNIVLVSGELAVIKYDGTTFTKETVTTIGVDPTEIASAVSDWLDEHPEATTTVEDNSITVAKLSADLKGLQYIKFGTGDGAPISIGQGCGADAGENSLGNIGIGVDTLKNKTTGYKNVTVGAENMCSYEAETTSQYGVLTGNRNTSIGYHSAYRLSSGDDNAAVGAESLDDITSGSQNTGMGAYAIQRNSKGNANTAVGYMALRGGANNVVYDKDKTFDNNVAVGALALSRNTSGNRNTAIGTKAMQTKNYNGCVAIGFGAGQNANGDNQFWLANAEDGTKAQALMYGEFNPTNLVNQLLRINAGKFLLPNLPTSDPLNAGQLWNDNGVLKISSGS